ncbi:hypothetical protein Moror_12899 [Moniliophthora roreri MCA 2997]|uniref:Nicotinamide-nucleotide adenylyltransferase n=2 Tax=Moniliophthora roreri TaxID=221103 RepID=V2XNB3_MONRO|nr:hypothetical protein Moror_12899 [Moniliophthora roreri MCA 2997]
MTALANSIHRLRSGLVFPPVELVYTAHSAWPYPNDIRPKRPLQISVLDSSFNPPTLAHLALANAPRPSYGNSHDYDAKLLLLSVRNADKQLKPSDATYIQRLEMMISLARDIVSFDEQGEEQKPGNVAVAIVDEPTFVGKSKLLQTFFKERTTPIDCRLTFLLGFDTLERFFAPRYYASEGDDAVSRMHIALRAFFAPQPEGDDSKVACARRSPTSYPQSAPKPNTPSDTEADSLMSTIQNFFTTQSLPSELVTMIDIGEDVWALSSSDARGAIGKDETWKEMVPPSVKEYIQREGLYSH